jgi:gluconolactonase
MELDVRDSRIHDLIDVDAGLTRIVSGFEFTEGPVWHPTEGYLLFSDIVGSKLYRWQPDNILTVFRAQSNMANGNTLDRHGRLLTCEHATSRVSRTLVQDGADAGYEVLASHFAGSELNSPNDIVVKQDGAIYFTDPLSGRSPYYGVPREPGQPVRGVYRLDVASGALTLLIDDFDKPNGLCFSQDERHLFVNDTARFHIRVFDVAPDGTLASGRVWAETRGEGKGVPDGMKIDTAGNLYCCGPGGIHLFDPSGVCLGVIRMPEHTANFVFGDDLQSLYITASSSIYRIRTRIPGGLTY